MVIVLKKVLNNSGTTLVEVIAAVVILALITAPLLSSIMQSVDTNKRTDIELKANTIMQKVMEEIKATKTIDTKYTTSAISGKDPGIYYNRNFSAEVQANDPGAWYRLYVKTTADAGYNRIITNKDYERWDFELLVSTDSSNPQVTMYKNIGEYNKKYKDSATTFGKLFVRNPVEATDSVDAANKGALVFDNTTGISSLNLELIGKLNNAATDTNDFRLDYSLDGGTTTQDVFTPGFGTVNTDSAAIKDNSIIVNVIRLTPTINTNPISLTIKNNTFYKLFYGAGLSSNVFNIISNQIKYHKNIIVNVFNDPPSVPATATNPASGYGILVNDKKPYVDVYRNPEQPWKVENGNVVSICIENIKDSSVKTKEISSSIDKDIN